MPENMDVLQDNFGQPPRYDESFSGGPTRVVSNLSAKDPDLSRSIHTRIIISSHYNDTGVYYRRGGRIVREPIMTALDALQERVALLIPALPASLPEDLGHSVVDAVTFRLPVLWSLADEDERSKADVDLLSLRGDLQPVWKWTKAGRTGFWHSNLDTVVEAGWWDAGRQLGLVVCGVDAGVASEVNSKLTKVFSLRQQQTEAGAK